MTLFPYTSFLEYYLLVYQPTFVGSNFLYPSGPYRFIIDKEKVIHEVESILTEFMSIMIGEKVNYKPNEEQREKLYAVLEILEENYNLNYNKMDMNEQKRRINNFMLTFSENVYEVRKNPFDIIGEYLSKLLEAPKTYQFMYNTKYSSYSDALLTIVEKIYSEGHNTKIAEFSKNITDEEFLGLFQHVRKINVTDLEYLNYNESNTTKAVIDKYISIYDDLSGNLEKYVRLLVWINKIFEGEVQDYTKIKRDNLANHVGHLRNQPAFKDLLDPFNVTIRNAISHKSSVFIDHITELITFIDTNTTVVKSYQEFVNETRELAAAWSVISNIGFIISLYSIRKLFFSTNLFNNPK